MTAALPALPRAPLATLPTPLRPAERLSAAVGAEVWLKRDDLTGFGLGGNKVRALEYLLGEATAAGFDCLVTGGGPQSNWAMLAALAARCRGLDAYLVFYGDPQPAAGNLLLARQAGATVRFTLDADRASVDREVAALGEKLEAAGRRPYLLPRGGATPLGALGYVSACLELAEQLATSKLEPAQLWLATGSCGTQAGLLAGARWLRLPFEVVGVAVSRPVEECRRRVAELAVGAARLLGIQPTASGQPEPTIVGGHLGPGYGLPSPEGNLAATLVAGTEGVFLDPVFGAKAMAGLLATVRSAPAAGPVVFLVSGGAPTLFAPEEAP
jgi:D-cysteine desulfhydrase